MYVSLPIDRSKKKKKNIEERLRLFTFIIIVITGNSYFFSIARSMSAITQRSASTWVHDADDDEATLRNVPLKQVKCLMFAGKQKHR